MVLHTLTRTKLFMVDFSVITMRATPPSVRQTFRGRQHRELVILTVAYALRNVLDVLDEPTFSNKQC